MTFEDQIEHVVRRVIREELDARAPAVPAPVGGLLTVGEVATRCGGVSAETVRGWIHGKKLRASRPGHAYLVAPEDLAKFLAERDAARPPPQVEAELHALESRIRRKRAG